MKVVDSDALGTVNKALGLTGRGAAVTSFEDGEVIQTLNVADLIRRGRTFAPSEGLFRCVLRTIHTGAEEISVGMQIYDPSATVVSTESAPYPSPVPAGFDAWILGASLSRSSGTGTCDGSLLLTNVGLGWGISSANLAISPNLKIPLAYWDTLEGTTATVSEKYNGISGSWHPLGLRVPRFSVSGTKILVTFECDATAASNWDCQLLVGLFPAGLGQDGVT